MADHDDDLSKTMVIPNPGGRRSSNYRQAPVTVPQSVLDTPQDPVSAHETEGLFLENILLARASELVNLASNLRTLEPNNSIEQLRNDINRYIEAFDKQLVAQDISQEVALTARYVLCCLLDELVLSTPWGIESSWSRQTLLSKYHNETSGGEKFFVIVNKLMEQPQRNIDLIELCYLCLSIGFRGKYRLSPSGENDVLQICNMMFQAISLYRPNANELSPAWRINTEDTTSIEKRLPPSLVFIFLAFVCIAVYIALLSNLHAQSYPLFEKIESVGWNDFAYEPQQAENNSTEKTAQVTPQRQQLSSVTADIKTRLSQSIINGLVNVEQQSGAVIIRFVSAQLFPPGSISVNEASLPDRTKLFNTIKAYTDSIVIVGHTDSTGRAESNWAISRSRAESIERWLKNSENRSLRTITRGVADTQPIAQNKSDSRNRRVEILIFPEDGA